jgi:hypothetical protein
MSKLGRFIFPYCIQKIKGSKNEYVVTNRDYKPIGFNTTATINYSDYPIIHKLSMTKRKASALSWDNDDNVDMIYLYNDGTNPLSNSKNMTAYFKRLELLSKMIVK